LNTWSLLAVGRAEQTVHKMLAMAQEVLEVTDVPLLVKILAVVERRSQFSVSLQALHTQSQLVLAQLAQRSEIGRMEVILRLAQLRLLAVVAVGIT